MSLRNAVSVTPRSNDVVRVSARSKSSARAECRQTLSTMYPRQVESKRVNVLECIRVEKHAVKSEHRSNSECSRRRSPVVNDSRIEDERTCRLRERVKPSCIWNVKEDAVIRHEP